MKQPTSFTLALLDQRMTGIYQNCTTEQTQLLKFLFVISRCSRKRVSFLTKHF